MKYFGLVVVIFFFSLSVMSQTTDTTVKKLPTEHFKQIIKGIYTDTLTTHIWIFGNTDCHRCEDLHSLFIERGLPWIEYEMHNPEYINLAYELVKSVAKTDKLSYSFPIVVVNNKVNYNVPDLKALADQIKANYRP